MILRISENYAETRVRAGFTPRKSYTHSCIHTYTKIERQYYTNTGRRYYFIPSAPIDTLHDITLHYIHLLRSKDSVSSSTKQSGEMKLASSLHESTGNAIKKHYRPLQDEYRSIGPFSNKPCLGILERARCPVLTGNL